MLKTFKTLLLREWMQHQRGWWILGLAPLGVALLGLVFGQVQVDPEDLRYPGGLFTVVALAYSLFVTSLATVMVAFQAPGLARRDVQDRSIEFWLSLPVSHAQALSATVLAHLWLFPLMALALGLVGSLLVAPIFLVRVFGPATVWTLPWASLVPVLMLGAFRLVLGLVVGMAWLAPALLVMMAASAWLKRWGTPLVVLVAGFTAMVLDKAYDLPQFGHWMADIWEQATQALWPGLGQPKAWESALLDPSLQGLQSLLWTDSAEVLLGLWSPSYALALGVAGVAFGLLHLRRQRA